jgi:REP element-mobilizing transposase RayT
MRVAHSIIASLSTARDSLRQSTRWQAAERSRMREPAVVLGEPARHIVERVVVDVCAHNGWMLQAANARTNHIHVVVSAPRDPESVLRTIKAWATRRLVEAALFERGAHVWSRHGSTVYLWTAASVDRAIWYVVNGQDA